MDQPFKLYLLTTCLTLILFSCSRTTCVNHAYNCKDGAVDTSLTGEYLISDSIAVQHWIDSNCTQTEKKGFLTPFENFDASTTWSPALYIERIEANKVHYLFLGCSQSDKKTHSIIHHFFKKSFK